MTQYILYAWGFYYFIVKVKGLPTYQNKYKFNSKRFKATWVNALKGIGLIFCGKAIAVFLSSLSYDIDKGKIDLVLGAPLVVFSIIKIAKILNKRDERGKI